MDNELQPQSPQPQPPVNAPQLMEPIEETKTLEEISGIKSQISETASPSSEAEMPGTPDIVTPDTESPRSRAEIYSKLTRIFVPVVIAVVIIGAGTAIYKLFLSSSDTAEPISESEAPGDTILPDTSEVLNEDLSDSLEKALEEGIEGGEKSPELSPDETQPKIPQIKPKK